MLMHQPKYLDQLLATAKQKNILCIADEVMTGFAEQVRISLINYLNNQPDIICLSKGITGGFMPLGVTACSHKIYDAFYADEMEKTFFHGIPTQPIHCLRSRNASLTLLLDDGCQQQIKMIADSHAAFGHSLKKMIL
jgi:adenosylmethionine-8-amino-7-oxononanoate aminotransferase